MSSFDLSDPGSYGGAGLEADLVMKGGITSGLVYPLAACRLATRYRFRAVGGASAGAIAAGLTAAAEYRRRTVTDPLDAGRGFGQLQTIPDVLGSTLPTLFVPAPALRRAWLAITAWLEPDWGWSAKAWATLRHTVAAEPLWFLLPALLALGLGSWVAASTAASGILVTTLQLVLWLLVGLVLGVLLAAVALGRGTLRRLAENGFGFCNGLADPATADAPPPLTPWLTSWLDDVAGLAPGQGPLTFGHLYGEAATKAFGQLADSPVDDPQSDAEVAGDDDPEGTTAAMPASVEPDIDLLLMTTCLSWGRPYTFPFRTRIFHYCPDCWRRYFPARVLAALERASEPASLGSRTEGGRQVPIDDSCVHPGHGKVRTLPAGPDLPVVVGIRMSLSFPVLLSAIPLQAVDYNRAARARGLVELWFSDGGITSNFPIHFFDKLLPLRPTFGINLADRHPDSNAMVYLPATNQARFPRVRPISSVVALLGAVFNTAQGWVDGMAVPAPGFRDRVVELRVDASEGGLNLKMTRDTIARLAERGDEAAREFEDFDFDNHRWIRYRTAMGAMTEVLDRLLRSYPRYRRFIGQRVGGSYPIRSRKARDRDRLATEQLVTLAESWRSAGYPALAGRLPQPRPALRPVPRHEK
jgi:predicted acylesterase/phospholipase RssA